MGSPETAGPAALAGIASPDPPAIPLAEEAGDALVVLVPPGPEAPGAARAAVSRWLEGATGAAALADILLVVSEVVTNSVRHAGISEDDLITVRAQRSEGRLRLEVEDAGAGGPSGVTRRVATVAPAGGFGLNLVDLLSERWGVSLSTGTQVWAVMPLAPVEG